MQIHYFRGWFRARKRGTDPLDEAAALKAYKDRELYTVVLGELRKPSCYLELKGDYIGVGFLDKLLREYQSYQFQELQPGRVFLTQAVYREYEGQAEKVALGTAYAFRTDGKVIIHKVNFQKKEESVNEGQTEVSDNWDSFPEFGHYDSLARVNRIKPPGMGAVTV